MKKSKIINQVFTSPWSILFLIQLLSLLIIFGTAYQIRYGITNADEVVFNSWFVYLFGVIPFPSIKAILVGIVVFMIMGTVKLAKSIHKKIASVLTSTGIVLLIIHLVLSSYRKEFQFTLSQNEFKSADYLVTKDRTETICPLRLKLLSTEKINYPSSDIAADYRSSILVTLGSDTITGVLSMNKPLHYKDYTFYQMSYSESLRSYLSTILVVKSRTGWSPYVGSLCLLLGLILNFLESITQNVRPGITSVMIFGLVIFSTFSTVVGKEINVSKMGKLLLVDNGRCKTMELYARQQCSFEVIKPGNRIQRPLDIMAEIMLSEGNIENVEMFSLPQKKTLKNIDKYIFSVKELRSIIDELQYRMISNPYSKSPQRMDQLQQLKNDYQKYSVLRKTFDTTNTLDLQGNYNNSKQVLYLIPVSGNKWKSVAELVHSTGPDEIEQLHFLRLLQTNYQTKNQKEFDVAVGNLFSYQHRIVPGLLHKGTFEYIYLQMKPFVWVGVLYLCALVLALYPLLGKFSLVLVRVISFLAFILQTFGLGLRWIISGHPPLTNPFDTFLLVSWICFLLLIFGRYGVKASTKTILASGTALIFLIISRITGNETDSFNVLSAVLNNSFWLIFHITTIVAGYAGFAASAVLAHVYLIKRISGSKTNFTLTLIPMYKIGFTLTIAGVLIGGIWADQSWGRFWGWDPKENGALVLILWSCSVLISYKENLLQYTGVAVGSIISLCIVIMTWIGVNVSGLGLHAYAESLNSTAILLFFIGSEILFLIGIGFLWWKSEVDIKKAPSKG
jgi:ABC-type transport system involved in cytochrome c biogenesis permease subunit